MPLNVLRNLENKKGPPLPALAVGIGILVLLLSVTGGNFSTNRAVRAFGVAD